jgi:Ca2+-binding EF-hand superfamily protein
MPVGFILAMLLQAGEAPPPPPADAPRRVWQQTFIAPSGEPFHAPEGEPYPSAAWFAHADTNHDGKLSFAEFNADFMRFFERLDANHDGVIDSAELATYQNRIAPEVHASSWYGSEGGEAGEHGGGHHGKHHGGGWGGGYHGGDEDEGGGGEDGESHYRPIGSSFAGYGPPRGAARFDLLRIPDPVAVMDVRFNGRINREAALEAAEQRFDLLDPDRRGYLTLADLPQTFVQQRGEHGRH